MRSSRKCWPSGNAGAASPVRRSLRVPAALLRQRGFLDFSFSELAIIFGLALVVLGPKKLPGLVQQVGRWVGRARHMARQFREQLEQEVNAININEVKPVPRNVAPEVGPPAPATAPAAEPHHDPASTEASGVAQSEPAAATVPPGEPPVAPDAPLNEVHPEAQIYFAMNGSEPEVVAQDPYAPSAADEPQASDTALPAAPGAAPPAPAKPAEPAQPASVEVVFPHDHG
jgi:sec-independent protein translocase protein TatB